MHPTILIGLDGATFTVLDSLMADGHMPFLKSFLERGVRSELMSTPHPLTPPAWTTLMTGRNPGNHGIYDFLRGEVGPGGAFFTLHDFRDVQCETLWTMVSRQGGRVTALNFPMTAPPPAVAGSIVPGLLSWRHLRRNVYPSELYGAIKALPGFNPRELSWDFENETAIQNMAEEELEPWVRFHIVREKHWFNILRHLMETDRCDLTAVMFDGVDKLQHGCWRFLDPAFWPAQPNAFEQRLRDLCLEYFRQMDEFIGDIVRLGGPDANVFIASDHGFGPSTRTFRVNKWLEQQGYLKWHPQATADGKGRERSNSHFVHLDWDRTTACARSAATNGIHIRVQQGPGDAGIPPEAYESFRDRLIEQLRDVRDPENGRPLLKDVLKREDVFPGTQMAKAPDLTLVPFDHGFISVLDAEPIIAIRPIVKGTHYPAGILLANGPAIRRGEQLERQSILDVAPTLLHSLGLPIPWDFEGRAIESVFASTYLEAHPVTLGPATEMPGGSDTPGNEAGLDAEGEEKVFNRLRALGYVE
jgi:predicted AlkP superfamily phosphohydrolase/phosphomutase